MFILSPESLCSLRSVLEMNIHVYVLIIIDVLYYQKRCNKMSYGKPSILQIYVHVYAF